MKSLVLESFGFILHTVRKHGWSVIDAENRGFSITFGGLPDSVSLEFPLKVDGELFAFDRGEHHPWRSKSSGRDKKLQVVNDIFETLRSLPMFHANYCYTRTVLKPAKEELMGKYQAHLDKQNGDLDEPVNTLFSPKIGEVGLVDCAMGILGGLSGKLFPMLTSSFPRKMLS